LSSTMISPSSEALIQKMVAWMGAATSESAEDPASSSNVKHIMYDAVSSSALIDASKATHGVAQIPAYHFDRAEVTVSFGADFLVNWKNPIGFARDYAKMRNPEGAMSRHYQFETAMPTTGSNADVRGAIK